MQALPRIAAPQFDARTARNRARRAVSLLATVAGALALSCGLHAGAAFAQAAGKTVSQPVVQALPNADSLRLSSALSRLGRDPRDINALIDAGNAALAMGDTDAAVGFFRRANQVAPRDGRVKAGLAGAMVRKGDPLSAIPLFEEAEQAGAVPASIAADRGLAYDLVGDNATAQRFYRLALARGADPDVIMRLALSQAMAGDRRGSEATLLPLLRDQDKSAWRTRAFALAILGQVDEAVRISQTVLPEQLAAAIAPYLRYMPTLTAAQQAAAANLGSFPRASEIGRDDPRMAQYAPTGVRARAASADAALVPQGAPLGSGARARKEDKPSRSSRREKERLAARGNAANRVAPPDLRPARQVTDANGELPPATPSPAFVSASALPAVGQIPQPVESAGAEVAVAAASEVTSLRPVAAKPVVASPAIASPAVPAAAAFARAPAVASASVPASPGFDLGRAPQSVPAASPAPASMSQPVATPAVDARPEIVAITTGSTVAPRAAAVLPPSPAVRTNGLSLADAFSDLGKPVPHAAPGAGAVDVTRITPAADPARLRAEAEKAKAEKARAEQVKAEKLKAEKAKAEKAKPSHPSRIWVQIGVGRDKKALAYDWRKYQRTAAGVMKGRKAWTSDMGATNRMLIGPFDSARAANTYLADLRKADFDGAFVWTSPAGQVVDPL